MHCSTWFIAQNLNSGEGYWSSAGVFHRVVMSITRCTRSCCIKDSFTRSIAKRNYHSVASAMELELVRSGESGGKSGQFSARTRTAGLQIIDRHYTPSTSGQGRDCTTSQYTIVTSGQRYGESGKRNEPELLCWIILAASAELRC
jgi:hypothetical protein